jgi:hypothetical protein
MPRLEDSLQITINDEPEPEPSPQLTANSGGSDMPDGKPIEAGAFIDKFMDDEIPLEDSLPEIDEPEFVMKPPPKDEDLFEEPEPVPKKQVKIKQEEIYPMDPEFKKRTPTGKLQKPKGINQNGKKRKPMSEEHKAKLAVAREKALAKRRANAQKRKEEREKLNPPKQEVSEPEPVKQERAPTPAKKRDSITREDLEEISLKTVIAMETMRKKRKEEKKKKQAEDKYKSEVMDTIRKANPSWVETSGIYANCY